MPEKRQTVSGYWIILPVMLFWIIFYSWLLRSSDGIQNITKFLNPRYRWLIGAAFLILVLFFCSGAVSFVRNKKNSLTGRLLSSALMLTAPLLFLPTALSGTLTAYPQKQPVQNITAEPSNPGVSSQSVSGQSPDNPSRQTEPVDNPEVAENKGTENAAPDISDLIGPTQLDGVSGGGNDPVKLCVYPEYFLDQEVTVVGLSFFYDDFQEGDFYLYRLLVTCCVADAVMVGVIVRNPEGIPIEEDKWYSVTGKFELIKVTDDEESYPGIEAETITEIESPEWPYLF